MLISAAIKLRMVSLQSEMNDADTHHRGGTKRLERGGREKREKRKFGKVSDGFSDTCSLPQRFLLLFCKLPLYSYNSFLFRFARIDFEIINS